MAETTSTVPTGSPPSWDGGRNYDQAGSIMDTGEPLLVHGAGTKGEAPNGVLVPNVVQFYEGQSFQAINDMPNLLQRGDIGDAKDASKKHIHRPMMVCQPEVKKSKKEITKDSLFDGSKTNNMASPSGREDSNLKYIPKVVTCNMKEWPPRGYQFASRDLKSVSLLGKGFSGIVYETIWLKKELRCARKDFVGVPRAVFEREIQILVRLQDHSNVVTTHGWAVAKICGSLVQELMDCSLRSLVQKKKKLRRLTTKKSTSSEPHLDSSPNATSTLGSGCSDTPEIPLIPPPQETEKKANGDLAAPSPVSASTSSSSEAQTSCSPFSILEVVEIPMAIAAGMKYLHDNNVAHGDLKPGNILVTLKRRAGNSSSFDDSLAFTAVKVADFGVIESKSMSRCMTSVSSETRELDKTRRKAPELFDLDHGLKQDFDALALGDVYSFGMTCSEILSGEEPYSDCQNSGVKTSQDLQELILKGSRPKLPDGCQQLNELITRCWDRDLTQRPKFGSILEELKKIQAALSVEEFIMSSKGKKFHYMSLIMK